MSVSLRFGICFGSVGFALKAHTKPTLVLAPYAVHLVRQSFREHEHVQTAAVQLAMFMAEQTDPEVGLMLSTVQRPQGAYKNLHIIPWACFPEIICRFLYADSPNPQNT